MGGGGNGDTPPLTDVPTAFPDGRVLPMIPMNIVGMTDFEFHCENDPDVLIGIQEVDFTA